MSQEDIFKKHPDLVGVWKVGNDVFMPEYQGSAKEFAARTGQKCEWLDAPGPSAKKASKVVKLEGAADGETAAETAEAADAAADDAAAETATDAAAAEDATKVEAAAPAKKGKK